MTSKIILFLIGCLKYSISNELQVQQNDMFVNDNNEFLKSECIHKLINKYFSHGSNIKLILTNDDLDHFYKIKDCCNVTYIAHIKDFIWTTNGYIINVNHKAQFVETMRLLKIDKTWNPRAKYIIDVKEILENEEHEIFNTLLDSNIFDVVLLKKHNSDTIELLTYFTFKNNNCGMAISNITSLGNCNHSNKTNMFPDKLENTFRNCTMKVAVSEDPPFVISKSNKDFQFLENIEGVEQYILSNIGKQENISIEYIFAPINARYGIILPNGSYTGSLTYVQNKTASILAGAFMLIKNRAEVFDIMFGYYFPTVKVFRSAVNEQSWKKVCQSFDVTTWLLIAITYIFVTKVIIVVHHFVVGNNDRQQIILRTWGYIFGNTDNNLIRVKKLRFLMIIWIFFTYFISSTYNTAFFSILTRKRKHISPAYDKQYTSFLTPCITESILTLFKFTYNETLETDYSPDCRYIENALDKVAEQKNLYTIYMDYNYQFREYKYIDKDGNRKIDTWDYALNYIMTMYAEKGFPLLKKFQRYISYFLETGLTEKHLSEIYFKSQLLKRQPIIRYKPATFSDFRIHFCILFFGAMISTICFITELKQ